MEEPQEDSPEAREQLETNGNFFVITLHTLHHALLHLPTDGNDVQANAPLDSALASQNPGTSSGNGTSTEESGEATGVHT